MYTLFFHGYSKGTPELTSCAAVLYENENENEIWWGNHFMGNNSKIVADYTGLIIGLTQAFVMKINNLIVKGDNLIVIKQMNGDYAIKSTKIILLYNKAKQLEELIGNVTYIHINSYENIRANYLSNMAIHYL